MTPPMAPDEIDPVDPTLAPPRPDDEPSLLSVSCAVCRGSVLLEEPPRPVTRADVGALFDDMSARDLVVAAASCPGCGTRYLAWVDYRIPTHDAARVNPVDETGVRELPYVDLSFRSTFRAYPSAADLPTADRLREVAVARRRQAIRGLQAQADDLIRQAREVTDLIQRARSRLHSPSRWEAWIATDPPATQPQPASHADQPHGQACLLAPREESGACPQCSSRRRS